MRDYQISVFYSDEDEQCIAEVPDLEGCTASGNTPDEAVHEVDIAKDLWLASTRENGDPVPAPRYRPAIYAAS